MVNMCFLEMMYLCYNLFPVSWKAAVPVYLRRPNIIVLVCILCECVRLMLYLPSLHDVLYLVRFHNTVYSYDDDKNTSGDEIANVNFFYDDIAHVFQKETKRELTSFNKLSDS